MQLNLNNVLTALLPDHKTIIGKCCSDYLRMTISGIVFDMTEKLSRKSMRHPEVNSANKFK